MSVLSRSEPGPAYLGVALGGLGHRAFRLDRELARREAEVVGQHLLHKGRRDRHRVLRPPHAPHGHAPRRRGAEEDIALHCIPLHCGAQRRTLHCITLLRRTEEDIALHYITLRGTEEDIALRYITLHCGGQRRTLHYITFHYIAGRRRGPRDSATTRVDGGHEERLSRPLVRWSIPSRHRGGSPADPTADGLSASLRSRVALALSVRPPLPAKGATKRRRLTDPRDPGSPPPHAAALKARRADAGRQRRVARARLLDEPPPRVDEALGSRMRR